MTHCDLPEAVQAAGRQVTVERRPPGTLIAAGVLQAGQALMWMFVGLLVGLGDADLRGDPVTVVLLIAAILAFSVGGFALCLAAGTLGRSEVCRVASVVFQVVFASVMIAGSIDLIRSHRTGLTITLHPATGPAFPINPEIVVVLLATCVAAVALLVCRPSTWATRRQRGLPG
jgi:hypothetical protein